MTDRKLTEAEMITYLQMSVELGNTARLAPEEAQTLLDLINRQKAEVEELETATDEAVSCFYRMESLYHIKCTELKVARAEAVKEFAERLENDSCKIIECNGITERVVSYQISPEGVDKIVKELTNENRSGN